MFVSAVCVYLQRNLKKKKREERRKRKTERKKERSNETLILVCNHGIGAMHAFEWTVLRKQCR